MNEVIRPGTPINLTLTLASTEYSATIPAGCQHFSIQCRTAFDVRFAFVTGKVAGSTSPFNTIKAGGSYTSPEKLSMAETTIYFATAEAGVIVELMPWIK